MPPRQGRLAIGEPIWEDTLSDAYHDEMEAWEQRERETAARCVRREKFLDPRQLLFDYYYLSGPERLGYDPERYNGWLRDWKGEILYRYIMKQPPETIVDALRKRVEAQEHQYVTTTSIRYALRAMGVTVETTKTKTAAVTAAKLDYTARNTEIVKLRAQGLTFEAIGKRFKLSRERIRQIIDKHARQALKKAQAVAWWERVHATAQWGPLPPPGKGRPLDMGGPRGVWIEDEPWDAPGAVNGLWLEVDLWDER